MQPEVIHGPGAAGPEHAGRVRVVDHHDRPVLLGHLDERRQRRDVAVHLEDPVGDQQLPPAGRLRLLEEPVGVIRVLVLEHLDLGSRQPGAVDD